MVTGSLEMVQCLKRIAQFYFTEAQIGSRNVAVMIEVDFQFNSGCDAITEVLYAVKNKILPPPELVLPPSQGGARRYQGGGGKLK